MASNNEKDFNDLKCPQCHFKFATKATVKRHIQVVHDSEIQQYLCDECGKAFQRKDYLTRHKKTHDFKQKVSKEPACSRNENICEDCGKSFARKDNLKRHLKTHTKSKVTIVRTGINDEKPAEVLPASEDINEKTIEMKDLLSRYETSIKQYYRRGRALDIFNFQR